MANTLDDLMPKILARALVRLRGRLVMPTAVNRDFSADAARRGATIDVPVPPNVAVREVSPGVFPDAAPDITENTVPISLDQWFEAPIAFTDRDRLEAIDASVEMAIDAAVDALAEKVNGSIFGLYRQIPGYVGTAGTTPFADDYALATEARKILNRNKTPLAFRRMVIDPDAEENATNLSQFADSGFSSDNRIIIEGDIGRKVGFDWVMDQQVPTHESTALTTGAATVNGAHAAGVSVVSIAKATNPSPLVEGDIISFAGHDQTYVVTEDVELAVGNTNVSIFPALKVALDGGEAVTLRASHVANLAFHRDAFAIAVRPFRAPASDARVLTMVDPATQLPLRLEVSRQNKQDYWSFDLLWGVKAVRPDLAVRVSG